MGQTDEDAVSAELSELIEGRLAPGFLGRADIEADVRDWLESSGLEAESAHDLVETMWLRHLADQEAWDQPGDHERLTRAFADLAASGFVTRMYFGCCRACAAEAIMAERVPGHWAFVYFDEESASELAGTPGLLPLSFGASTWWPTRRDAVNCSSAANGGVSVFRAPERGTQPARAR